LSGLCAFDQIVVFHFKILKLRSHPVGVEDVAKKEDSGYGRFEKFLQLECQLTQGWLGIGERVNLGTSSSSKHSWRAVVGFTGE
jgi:hypothetical protein